MPNRKVLAVGNTILADIPVATVIALYVTEYFGLDWFVASSAEPRARDDQRLPEVVWRGNPLQDQGEHDMWVRAGST
jgi:hypothetical protein